MFNKLRYSFALVLAAATFATTAQAQLIQSAAPATTDINGVAINPAVTTIVDGTSQKLSLIGAGLRSKKVAIVWVKVYVAQAYAQNPDAFKRGENTALASIPAVGTSAIKLTFVRTVDAATVQNSFRDAFFANNIDVNKAEIAAFLDAVAAGGDAVDGSSLTVRGRVLSDGSEEIAYEGSRGAVKTIAGPAGFIKQVFALWYGTPVDGGLAGLKASLLQKP